MSKLFVLKLLIVMSSFGGTLFAYVKQQNDLTRIRIDLPRLASQVRQIEEENTRLKMEIEKFENPKHLMQLAKRPEFSHLKHPICGDVLVVETKSASSVLEEGFQGFEESSKRQSVFIGAR